MATIEDRVARLEQQAAERLDAQLDAGLRATAYGISLVQADVAEVKAAVAELREQVATRADLAALDAKLDAILARLAG